MAASSESIPANDQYLRELGRATYNFAYLEWAVVWLTETTEPGFLSEATTLTAGHIAKKFTNAVEKVPASDQDKIELADLARRFGELVEERNRLIHGNPYTAETGEQRLLYSGKHGGKDWTTRAYQAVFRRSGRSCASGCTPAAQREVRKVETRFSLIIITVAKGLTRPSAAP